jgi:hypothetical protein
MGYQREYIIKWSLEGWKCMVVSCEIGIAFFMLLIDLALKMVMWCVRYEVSLLVSSFIQFTILVQFISIKTYICSHYSLLLDNIPQQNYIINIIYIIYFSKHHTYIYFYWSYLIRMIMADEMFFSTMVKDGVPATHPIA